MGTHGRRVYRYRGYYFVRYKYYDSYPAGYGAEVLNSVPQKRDEYRAYVERMKRDLEHHLEKWLENGRRLVDDSFGIEEKQPQTDLDYMWVYEIDFDNEVFHVNSQPFFRLDNLPPLEVFLDSIGYDSYGHRACRASTPAEYRYSWTPPPPKVNQTLLDAYQSQIESLGKIDGLTNEISGPADGMDERLRAQLHLYQAFIGHLMRDEYFAKGVHLLEQASNSDDISDSLVVNGFALLSLPLKPLYFTRLIGWGRLRRTPRNLSWLLPNLYFNLATHLDDEGVLRAQVIEARDAVMASVGKTGTVYAMIFSFFHCVIVCIDTENGAFKHTGALQFLPSYHATSPTTPGMTAWMRLAFSLPYSGLYKKVSAPVHTNNDLPLEIWDLIAQHLFRLRDLVRLGQVSWTCREAAHAILKFPHVEGFRLYKVIPHYFEELEESQANDSEMEETRETYVQALPVLTHASFYTMAPGFSSILTVGGQMEQYYKGGSDTLGTDLTSGRFQHPCPFLYAAEWEQVYWRVW